MKIPNEVKMHFFNNRIIGTIENEETYEKVKSGESDWNDYNKKRITHYIIPVAVFERLLDLDRNNDLINSPNYKYNKMLEENDE